MRMVRMQHLWQPSCSRATKPSGPERAFSNPSLSPDTKMFATSTHLCCQLLFMVALLGLGPHIYISSLSSLRTSASSRWLKRGDCLMSVGWDGAEGQVDWPADVMRRQGMWRWLRGISNSHLCVRVVCKTIWCCFSIGTRCCILERSGQLVVSPKSWSCSWSSKLWGMETQNPWTPQSSMGWCICACMGDEMEDDNQWQLQVLPL